MVIDARDRFMDLDRIAKTVKLLLSREKFSEVKQIMQRLPEDAKDKVRSLLPGYESARHG